MFPLQEHQQPSKRERIKGSIRNLFSSNGRAVRNSTAHHSPPTNVDHDVAASCPTSVSSRTDLVSGNDTASTSKSPLGAGKRIVHTLFTFNSSVLIDHVSTPNVATSATVQTTGNIMSHSPPQTADPTLPLSTTHPYRDHRQNSTTKRSFLIACHGVEQLLKRVEGCLGGTPFKVPVNVLNTVIDIGKVCSHLAVSMQGLIMS
jgi:hypothetical protein